MAVSAFLGCSGILTLSRFLDVPILIDVPFLDMQIWSMLPEGQRR